MAYPQARIETSSGPITVELWDDVAPKHVANFLKLASDGFYDGLLFHRVIPGFMLQGGCPDGNGMGGPGWTVDAEFNDREHHEGVLSMARSNDPDSAGSQFFVCLGRDHCQHLDGKYTAFGTVVKGIEAVHAIAAAEIGPGDAPLSPQTMTSVSAIE